MKIAIKFHSLRGEKSALVLCKANPLAFSASPVYASRSGVEAMFGKPAADLTEGDEITYDTNVYGDLNIVDMVDSDTGEVRTTKTGETLKTFA